MQKILYRKDVEIVGILNRLSDKEYEDLSEEFEQNPPALSGKPGFLTGLRERALISELLSPVYARIVYIVNPPGEKLYVCRQPMVSWQTPQSRYK